ncbi:gamma-glutamyl-gamma-aminobutyrate hydrolase family protein [Lacticaseibacillus yichunensis]|uniref:Gamma-glutamyl-gamma-aminobutyrate hydrolase family protein n=1 Tax=Lacticaseibacillus yichunensis TaxID=2486015 RepID=A0ABW4CR23_9LACO|nr:gamma-glutamyl-gamma-aminobutyrate hydrolase family protein [Lacticaseibacillus yichunensis]
MRPLIAIAADVIEDTSVFTKPNTVDIAPTMFKDTVIEAGGVPVIIPFPTHMREAPGLIERFVSLFDGLIIPGGPNVDPTRYGEQPGPFIGAAMPRRDAFELALIKATRAARKPMFGLCRGSHILNVACGGSLYQDLASQKQDSLRHLQRTSGEYPTHHVTIARDSRLFSLIGETAYVNSRHHQAVRNLGRGLKAIATAPDGTVEGFESTDDDLIFGLQWHPENLWQDDPAELSIYQDFIARAAAHQEAAGAL